MSWILDYSPIFDFDGLLVNTEHLHFQAYQRMLEENGASFPWDFPSFAAVAHKSSEGLRKLITSHAPALVKSKTWDILYDEKKGEYAKLLEAGSLDLMPGAQTILETVQMAKIPHAVVTNSTRKQTEMIREKFLYLITSLIGLLGKIMKVPNLHLMLTLKRLKCWENQIKCSVLKMPFAAFELLKALQSPLFLFVLRIILRCMMFQKMPCIIIPLLQIC